ncbi:MAG: short-chain dehydrogenase [Bacteroidetes bacterium]|nr:short-chain dehydrogenase [Bacteroidota bacterium]MBS1974569.1 short-chain dehydrogenase [Bacteroidota bacterium]
MTIEVIEKFIQDQSRKGTAVNIHFKDRNTVNGIFIYSRDYDELKSKNLWRVVHRSSIGKWKESQDINLTRIFNGIAFTRLSDER